MSEAVIVVSNVKINVGGDDSFQSTNFHSIISADLCNICRCPDLIQLKVF